MQSALLICAGLLFPVRLLCLRVPVLSEAAAFLGTWILTLVCSYWLACFIWSKTLRKAVSTEGKAVLVTGCDTGFGHHAAKRFAQDGFTVFAGCLNAASDGAKELATRANVHVLQLDITSDDQVYKALDEVKKSLGSNGRVTIPGTTVYCMSKHAMLSLVDGLRRECEEAGVDVAAVEPTAYRNGTRRRRKKYGIHHRLPSTKSEKLITMTAL
ncbi:hypothetical protein V5799_033412 [Amblyomma americanum]|uniref:Uncharacterized protein n=1 Tax=Amblyomma americanum TaxID=6943 RepID=A0AAQ4DNE3_AMBAM